MREILDKHGIIVKDGDTVRISTIQIRGEYLVRIEKYREPELVVDIPSESGRPYTRLYMFHPYSFELIKTVTIPAKTGPPGSTCICSTFERRSYDRSKPHHPDCLMLKATGSIMVSAAVAKIPSAMGPNVRAYFEVKRISGWSDETILSVATERDLTIEELRKEVVAGKL
ncbi:MAG TPA: hypothetical protein VFC63_06140 [Blastocatellia bacterium]|nr:hypothetical protein [Blastocatellia bacterium]